MERFKVLYAIVNGKSRGDLRVSVVYSYPRYMPAPPAPAQTRPTIMASMDCAAPQTALAAAKFTRQAMKTHLLSKVLKAFPSGRIITVEPRVKPTPSHPSRETLSNVSDTAPWMSATMGISAQHALFETTLPSGHATRLVKAARSESSAQVCMRKVHKGTYRSRIGGWQRRR